MDALTSSSDGCPRADQIQEPKQRADFRRWLQAHRGEVMKLALPAIVARYGRLISISSAYRVAVSLQLRGHRKNVSRYERFWKSINWRLPDSTLSSIWGVRRGNLRNRRVRLGIGDASYDKRIDRRSKRYQTEVVHEIRRSKSYTGARPR